MWEMIVNMSENEAVQIIETLNSNEFIAEYFNKKEEVIKKTLELIPEKASIGIAGSITIRSLGIKEMLINRGCKIFDIWEDGLSKKEVLDVRRAQLTCDVLLCSTNAITLNGELVNIDNSGNRVAAMTFGPQKVIVIAGINKIVRDIKAAVNRTKNVAAPKITNYLGYKTLCSSSGYCHNCKPPETMCRVTSIIGVKPRAAGDYYIFLVGEELGF